MARDGEKIVRRGIYLYIDGKQVKASITEIEREMRSIQRAQKKMTVGSEEYVRAGEKIRSLKGILVEHRAQLRAVAAETQKHSLSIGKLADGFNKYAGMAAGALGAITGLTFTIRRATQAYVDMEEAQSQVVKYTGLSKEAVKELNEELKKMDTRTARERLNELAGDAGRLGISSKEEILEFVDAADKINVALGEDLGEDAVKNIGKLAQMFGEDKTKGLRGAMLATGSAINEVAQNSSASEPYLVEFTARVAGAAHQAKISQADILGYASVLDQNMQQVEMSGTAFQGVLMKMYQEPAKFAKIAGKDVKEFTKLLKEDANEAVLQFIESLSKRGGLDDLAPIFKDMKLDGARAAGVLSTMANNIDRIRIEQRRANEAYEDGTSILKEFNVQNNTAKAELEKRIKLFKDYVIVLGEKLLPVASKLVSTGSLGIKVLGTLTTFLIENKGAIIAAAVAVASYYLVAQRATIASRALSLVINTLRISLTAYKGTILLAQSAFFLLTGQTQKATVAMRAFSIVTKASPVGALTALVIGLGSAFYLLTKKMDENERVRRKLLSLNAEAKVAAENEKTQTLQLLKVAQDYSKSMGERNLAIKKLNEISPEYLGVLNLENINTETAKKAVDRYTKSLLLNMKVKRITAAIDENQGKLEDYMKDPGKSSRFYDGFLKMTADAFDQVSHFFTNAGSSTAAYIYDTIYGGRYRDATNAIIAENDKLLAELGKTNEEIIALESANLQGPGGNQDDDKDPYKPDLTDSEKEKQKREAINKVLAEYEQKKNDIRKKYLSGDIKTQEEYEAEMRKIELESLKALMKVHGLTEKEQADYQAKYLDMQLALQKKLEEIDSEISLYDEDEYAKQIKALRKNLEDQEQVIQDAFGVHLLDENERQGKLIDLRLFYAKKEGEITKKKIEKEAELEKEHAERLTKALIEKTKERFDKLENMDSDNIFSAFDNIKQLREVYQSELEELLDPELDDKHLAESLFELEVLTKEQAKKISGTVKDLAVDVGTTLGDMFMSEEGFLKSFLKGSLIMLLDFIKQKIMIARVNALTDALMTLNPIKAAKAFAEIVLVEAAFQVVKHQVNGFDTGGYTGRGTWNEPAGIVHKEEFVANRFAVANPNVKPVLDLVDAAQRSGTVSALTREDIAAVSGGSSTSSNQISAKGTSGSSAADSHIPALLSVLSQVNRTLEQVKERFESPIVAETYATGKGGVNEAQKLVNKMEANASRKR